MQPTTIITSLFAATITGAVLALQHYVGLPWWAQRYRQPMPLLVRYILGTLALQIAIIAALIGAPCLTWLDVAFAALTITTLGGLVTISCHLVDEQTKKRAMKSHPKGGR